jgi:RND superfamily putative drug exporter
LTSRDGRQTVVAATLGADADQTASSKAIITALHGLPGVVIGGSDVAGYQTGQQATKDLGIAEALAFPLLAILALLIFRGLATLLPLLVGGLSVLSTFLILRLVNEVLPLSTFALNLVIGLGLGLAVDYSLFLVARFREQLAAGDDVHAAVRTTVVTTGRTIIFSAVTVAAALACLTVFPQRFLVSMGIGGAVVALVAASAALLVLPAAFTLLGTRVARTVHGDDPDGPWYRLAAAVMRRPALVATATIVILVVLASPAPGVHWSGIDASVLPHSQSASVAQSDITRDFPGLSGAAPTLVVATADPSAGTALRAYATDLAAVPTVTSVSAPTRLAGDIWELTVADPADPISAAGQHVLSRLEAVVAPAPVLFGGPAADFHDQGAAIESRIPLALGLLIAITLIVLWIMTGSVVLPVKALLMNALTTAAATGILVFVFQHGRLSGLLSYTTQHGIEETDFVVLAALVFALSTDYGVFLLSRIKEVHDTGADDRQAIATGMQRTGRLITSASVLLAVAIGAFSTSKLLFLKEVGVGTAAAVLLDAFVVRALLVPSLMALLGPANWWSPGPLRRLFARIHVG